MTTVQLLLYLLLVLFVQITLAALVALYRHLRSYQHLQKRMAGMGDEVPPEPSLKDLMAKNNAVNVAPWKGLREFSVVRRVPESLDENICSFYLRPTDRQPLPRYKPGQFLTFTLDIPNPKTGEAESVTRCYSLSDRPGQSYYRVSIKRVPFPFDRPDLLPGVASNHFHNRVLEGDTVQVRAPSGHFFLEPDTTPIVLVAGGIGITPMLSMVEATLKSKSERQIWLFYGVTNSHDQGMKDELEDLASKHDNLNLFVCYAKPKPKDKLNVDFHHEGFIDVPLLKNTLPYQVYDYFICGPRPMMETLVPALEDWGVPDQHIHYEAFGPASIIRKAATSTTDGADEGAAPVNVTFSKSGKTLVWDGGSETLLDFAEKNGIAVDSGCRAGGCGCCQTKIESGEVDYTHIPDYDAEPGTCLMCVARPTQDLTVEA